MSARRTTAIAVSVAVLSGVFLAAPPAQAHGAMGAPVSRALECGPLGGTAAKSAACKAADSAVDWDNLRVPNVNGQDRQKIPDGKLCSAGLPAFKGLDLARSDWPTTSLTAGAAFTFQYRVAIPHQGSFRLYVTKDGYSPTQPLRWTDLEAAPFATATDPPIQNGSYVFKATLPAKKTGRQLIYTIWQTSSTPDTYYSCSDVVFTGGAGAPAAPAPTGAPAAGPSATGPPSAAATASPSSATDSATPSSVPLQAVSQSTPLGLPLAVLAGVVVLIGGVLFLVSRRRRAPVPAHHRPDPFRDGNSR
jgi:chitin-binding protein